MHKARETSVSNQMSMAGSLIGRSWECQVAFWCKKIVGNVFSLVPTPFQCYGSEKVLCQFWSILRSSRAKKGYGVKEKIKYNGQNYFLGKALDKMKIHCGKGCGKMKWRGNSYNPSTCIHRIKASHLYQHHFFCRGEKGGSFYFI